MCGGGPNEESNEVAAQTGMRSRSVSMEVSRAPTQDDEKVDERRIKTVYFDAAGHQHVHFP